MLNPKSNFLSVATLAVLAFGCTSNPAPSGGSGGSNQATSGGSSANSSAGPSKGGGKTTGEGGATQDSTDDSTPSDGGATDTESSTTAKGGKSSTTSKSNPIGGKSGATGGKSGATGGKSSTSSSKAAGGNGGSQGGSTETSAGGQDTSAGGTQATGPASYALPPPSQCHNQDQIPWGTTPTSGCKEGDANTMCGGKCNVINACAESEATKRYADITFICPRFMLFSPEMIQAAKDDGNEGFNYAIVGHDTDPSGIDGAGTQSTCCQCYQLVYAYPSPKNERQCLDNPNDLDCKTSGIPIPPPLIVQSFNTAATPQTFDVYMAAGGLGAHNACAHLQIGGQELMSASGKYLYSSYPTVGQGSGGGVKPVTHFEAECKTTQTRWVTTETFSSDACQNKTKAACNEIESSIPGLTEQSRNSCIKSNAPESPYHLNWSVYAMKVECPAHLTQVTGCKLAPQGLPQVKQNVTTAAQAAADSGFKARANGGSDLYETTTMEDCCRPSCAAIDWVEKKGLKPDGKYNAFYSCDIKGVPITEKE